MAEKRTAKFYDFVLNQRIRELTENEDTAGFAKAIGVSAEAVRQWTAGYSRPDVEKIILIADYFRISTDYLFGRTEEKTLDMEKIAACRYTGLSESTIDLLRQSHDSDFPASEVVNGICESRSYSVFSNYCRKKLLLLGYFLDETLLVPEDEENAIKEFEIQLAPNGFDYNLTIPTSDAECYYRYEATKAMESIIEEIFDRPLLCERALSLARRNAGQ